MEKDRTQSLQFTGPHSPHPLHVCIITHTANEPTAADQWCIWVNDELQSQHQSWRAGEPQHHTLHTDKGILQTS